MRILMLSDAETAGGAAIAASRLAAALGREGHSVHRVVLMPDGGKHPWETHVLAPSLSLPLKVLARSLAPAHRNRFFTGSCLRRLRELLRNIRPDVINIHNLHIAVSSGWSQELVEVCCDSAPAAWTLHDMWSFTGRCAYSYDCMKFIDGCDASCPTPEEYPALEPTKIHDAWIAKKNLLRGQNKLAAVCPSRWLADEARKGAWSSRKIVVIPYGVPLETYEPLDRDLARKALGLSAAGPVLLTVAYGLNERRKGGAILASALRRVTKKPLTLVTMGGSPVLTDEEGIRVQHLGFIDHERTRALAYNAADLLIHPAPVDNLPNVLLEAVACGTPIVAFNTGGIPDVVRANVSGWIAADISAECLAETIDRAIDALKMNNYRKECRALAESEYPMQQQAKRYGALFDDLRNSGSQG